MSVHDSVLFLITVDLVFDGFDVICFFVMVKNFFRSRNCLIFIVLILLDSTFEFFSRRLLSIHVNGTSWGGLHLVFFRFRYIQVHSKLLDYWLGDDLSIWLIAFLFRFIDSILHGLIFNNLVFRDFLWL
jgi:hypothetical protein